MPPLDADLARPGLAISVSAGSMTPFHILFDVTLLEIKVLLPRLNSIRLVEDKGSAADSCDSV